MISIGGKGRNQTMCKITSYEHTSVHYLQTPEILKTTDNGHGYWSENVLRDIPMVVQRAACDMQFHQTTISKTKIS